MPALLRELEMTRALIPVNPAMFSAWGLLNADFREDLNRQIVRPLTTLDPAEVAAVMDGLAAEAVAHLRANQIDDAATVLEYFADLRYLGQEHTVRVPLLRSDLETPRLAATKARFDEYHEQAYAHNLPDRGRTGQRAAGGARSAPTSRRCPSSRRRPRGRPTPSARGGRSSLPAQATRWTVPSTTARCSAPARRSPGLPSSKNRPRPRWFRPTRR
ncbi:MAG: hypothetical protein R2854_14235 [Caldilineaceae bacterium]